MQAGNVKPLRVFWSYSHRDEALRDELHEHLAGLRRAGLIDDWHDRKIDAGTMWKDEIDRHLGDADIVLLLVSASFIASEYCWGDEMTKALARHETDEARVIPVILRPCDWLDTPIARLQAVPKDARPITQWADRDVAYVDIAAAIRRAVRELMEVRAKPEPPQAPPTPRPNPLPQAGQGDARQNPRPLAGEGGARDSGRVRAAPKNGISIGVDPRELPDLAVFKDADAPWCPEMVVIPAGSFLMGSPPDEPDRSDNEGPQHRVTIASRFAIGRYPIAVGQYSRFVEKTQRQQGKIKEWSDGFLGIGKGWKDGERDWKNPGFAQTNQHPVVAISWQDAAAYCEWLSRDTGQPYRLPSEAEWEYACRAGTTTPFSFGPTISPSQANYDGNFTYANGAKGVYREKTVAVGSLPASPWGLHEMHGNVWEWVEDVWHDDHSGAPIDGSAWTDREGKESDRDRVVRGGSWSNFPGRCRSAVRYRVEPGGRGRWLGFRLARTLS